MSVFWLIEFQENANDPKGVGYIKDIITDGTYDVILTRDSCKAMKFDSKYSAESILDDTAFLHAMGHIREKLFVRDHLFIEESETKWECPFCGREMKGLDIFPNEACCGEVGRAQKVVIDQD